MKFPILFSHTPGNLVGDWRMWKLPVVPQVPQTWNMSISSAFTTTVIHLLLRIHVEAELWLIGDHGHSAKLPEIFTVFPIRYVLDFSYGSPTQTTKLGTCRSQHLRLSYNLWFLFKNKIIQENTWCKMLCYYSSFQCFSFIFSFYCLKTYYNTFKHGFKIQRL